MNTATSNDTEILVRYSRRGLIAPAHPAALAACVSAMTGAVAVIASLLYYDR